LDSKSLLQNLSIVTGATILSIIGPNILDYFPFGWIRDTFLLVLALLFLLYGFGSIRMIIKFIRQKLRDSSTFRPQIGILYGISPGRADSIPLVWSDDSPNTLKGRITGIADAMNREIKVNLIYTNEAFDKYNVIINPFGGCYPESSFDKFPVYYKLLEYIRKGGIFVNVADVPTYWAYNPHIGRKLDRTPPVYGVRGEEVRYFKLTPLMQELGLRVLNVEQPNSTAWQVRMSPKYRQYSDKIIKLVPSRAVVVEGNVEPIIAPREENGHLLTPLFLCSYGNGRCLISLSFLDNKFRSNGFLKDIICMATIDELKHQLHNKQ